MKTCIMNSQIIVFYFTVLSGGPFKDHYRFSQIHMHWGKSSEGSEHRIGGKPYAGEVSLKKIISFYKI